MKNIMERVLNELTDHKAQGDIFFSTSKSLKLSAQKGNISEYKVSSSQILGVRAIKNDRVGISYSEALDEESIKLLVKEVLENAQATEANPHEKILELTGNLSDEAKYLDEDIDIQTKIKKALELESKVKERDQRVVAVPHNSLSENEYESYYLSSRGRSTSYKDRSYSIVSSALLEEAGKKANFYHYDMAHNFKDLNWETVIQTPLDHARNLLKEKSLTTGKYHVEFSPDCLENLIGCFSNLYSAKSSMDKMNPWSEKLGQEVISKDLSIEDCPSYAGAFRKSLFDSEGVEQKPLTLVKEGVLTSLYHNSVTADFFKTKTTGHASRGASSSINVSGTHMLIHGNNVKARPTKYLEVIQMDGLYSGANRVTGSFSVGIKGYLWENGEKVMTFGNCTLSGNLMELLKNAEIVSSDIQCSTGKSFFSVPLMFNNLSIAGA